MAKTESGAKREFVAVQNRKARHDYEVMGRYETGIVLRGTEVKSLRAGRANLKDSFRLSLNEAKFFCTMSTLLSTSEAIISTTIQSACANCSCTAAKSAG